MLSVLDQAAGRFFSSEDPLNSGPRNCGQFAPYTWDTASTRPKDNRTVFMPATLSAREPLQSQNCLCLALSDAYSISANFAELGDPTGVHPFRHEYVPFRIEARIVRMQELASHPIFSIRRRT